MLLYDTIQSIHFQTHDLIPSTSPTPLTSSLPSSSSLIPSLYTIQTLLIYIITPLFPESRVLVHRLHTSNLTASSTYMCDHHYVCPAPPTALAAPKPPTHLAFPAVLYPAHCCLPHRPSPQANHRRSSPSTRASTGRGGATGCTTT